MSQNYTRWFVDYPSTHRLAGQTVEVTPVADYERAVSAINRLITHLDEANPVSVITEPRGEVSDVHDWLMLHCFGEDHELYDDLMCLPGVTKSWERT